MDSNKMQCLYISAKNNFNFKLAILDKVDSTCFGDVVFPFVHRLKWYNLQLILHIFVDALTSNMRSTVCCNYMHTAFFSVLRSEVMSFCHVIMTCIANTIGKKKLDLT